MRQMEILALYLLIRNWLNATVDGSNIITDWQGIPSSNNADAAATISINTGQKLSMLFHTHPSIGNGTLSVFSDADLIAIATSIRRQAITTDKFVAYLATSKGTYLALTITDPQKLLDLLYSETFPASGEGIGDSDWGKIIASEKKFKSLQDKYYNVNNPNRLLIETNTDNEKVLKNFLKFLNDADAGVNIYESDSNFSSFKRLVLNGENVERKTTCN